MTKKSWNMGVMVVAVAVLFGGASGAYAQSQTTETTSTTVTAPPAPQPVVTQPAPAPVVVQPAPSAPAAPSKSKQVITETHSENYMLTIAKSVFFGAVAGALVGTAVYFIDHENHPRNIAYWGAGGAVAGGVVGLVQIAVNENRTEQAVSSMEQKSGKPQGVAFMPRLVNVSF
jgi:hypothetical protein